MLDVQTDVLAALAKLQTITEARQFRFAVAKALTKTAVEVQAEVRKNMPSRFTIRRPWTLQGIRIVPATKESLTASVYSRDKFMALQETGGTKNPLGNFIAIPTRAVRRTKRDSIRLSDRPKALGDKAHVVDVNGDKYLALKKPRRGKNGNELRLLYLLVPRAQLEERLGLNKDGQRVARARFVENLRVALAAAVATAR
ncbi:MAG: DUF6441 family protein [Burkholderiaceae bacterium]|jgi:hypothetical protein|nr:DUF6441 family protein [Burkholderiaceae bacterium]